MAEFTGGGIGLLAAEVLHTEGAWGGGGVLGSWPQTDFPRSPDWPWLAVTRGDWEAASISLLTN